MSLFDVIRYPITDIFDPEQVDCLPKVILIEWMKECIAFIGWDTSINVYEITNFAFMTQMMIVEKSRNDWKRMNDDRFIQAFKAYFTISLRRRIEEYDSTPV
jgi:hypothetical protein